MIRVGDKMPTGGTQYAVRRRGQWFIATPCYGQHKPWWRARTVTGDAGPVGMEDDDEYLSVREFELLMERAP